MIFDVILSPTVLVSFSSMLGLEIMNCEHRRAGLNHEVMIPAARHAHPNKAHYSHTPSFAVVCLPTDEFLAMLREECFI